VRAWCVCADSDAKTRFLVPWHPAVAATNNLTTDLLPTREVPCVWPAPVLAGWCCYLGSCRWALCAVTCGGRREQRGERAAVSKAPRKTRLFTASPPPPPRPPHPHLAFLLWVRARADPVIKKSGCDTRRTSAHPASRPEAGSRFRGRSGSNTIWSDACHV
jgi:hypothetical protein